MTKRRPFNSMAETIVDLIAQLAIEHYENWHRPQAKRSQERSAMKGMGQ